MSSEGHIYINCFPAPSSQRSGIKALAERQFPAVSSPESPLRQCELRQFTHPPSQHIMSPLSAPSKSTQKSPNYDLTPIQLNRPCECFPSLVTSVEYNWRDILGNDCSVSFHTFWRRILVLTLLQSRFRLNPWTNLYLLKCW